MPQLDDLPILVALIVVACLLLTKQRAPRVPAASVLAAVIVGLVTLPIPYICERLGAPQYNLAELFRQDTMFPGIRLAFLLMWIPLTARWAADQWRDGARFKAAAWGLSGCVVGWGFLRRSVTVESIHDILGAPILGLPMDAEYILRFGCLYFSLLWLPVFFAVHALASRKGLFTWGTFALILTLAMPAIIQHYSPSDNVRELLRHQGGHFLAVFCLYVTMVAVLCGRVALRNALAIAALAIVPAWMLLSRSMDLSAVHGMRIGLPAFVLMFVGGIAMAATAFSPWPEKITSSGADDQD
ncbi:MAG: hypothetical protein ACYTHJ_00540 [Planctomycetota bacterium]|jgi:hypothetical protein